MPFGSHGGGAFGTCFLGDARTPALTEEMLRHMLPGDGPVTHDRILDFCTAVTGGLFFVPAAGLLDGLADTPPPPPADERSASGDAKTG